MTAAVPAPRPGPMETASAAGDDDRATPTVDGATCPLCGEPNDCVIGDAARRDEICWCVGHRFPDRLFAQIPAEDLGRRCVCARCALGSGDAGEPPDAGRRRR